MTGDPTILVADDDGAIVDLYAAWLTSVGEVRTANSGEGALDALDRDVDIAVLDRRMPDVSGDRVVERIDDRGLDCRTVMVTGVSPDFDVVSLGVDDYLVKPVCRERLVETVEDQVDCVRDPDRAADLHSLKRTRDALERAMTPEALAASETYQTLVERIETVEREADGRLTAEDAPSAAGRKDYRGRRSEAE